MSFARRSEVASASMHTPADALCEILFAWKRPRPPGCTCSPYCAHMLIALSDTSGSAPTPTTTPEPEHSEIEFPFK